MPVWKLIYIFICQNKSVRLRVFMLIVLPAILLIGELDLHSENIICGGGHRTYQCRSIDTDY